MENKNTETSPMLEHDEVVLEWKTPEFIPHPKGPVWFMTAAGLMVTFTAYAILTGSATMAIVFILLGGVYYLTHNQAPRILSIKITKLGLYVGNRFYPFNNLNAFWIVYNPPYVRRLYLRTSDKTNREIKIELNDQSPVTLRHALAREIPEIEGGQENKADILIRLLRLQ